MSVARLIEVGAPRVVEHAPFGARTTYRVGGSVRCLVTLRDHADLDELGPLLFDGELDVCVLGNGSNLLVADGEHEVIGVVLTGEFEDLSWHQNGDDVVVHAGAALDLPIAARRLAREGIVGFEWAVGVPGTFGGAVVMNAGGHGSDMAASVTSAEIATKGGERSWTHEELDFAYRSSGVPHSSIVTSVELGLTRGDAEASQEQIREVVRWRREHQPGGANAGSVFRNPEGDFAARLIEATGLKGLRIGSAQVSEKHANFIIADADGRAGDVYAVMIAVRDAVLAATGVRLHSEHRFLGFEAP